MADRGGQETLRKSLSRSHLERASERTLWVFARVAAAADLNAHPRGFAAPTHPRSPASIDHPEWRLLTTMSIAATWTIGLHLLPPRLGRDAAGGDDRDGWRNGHRPVAPVTTVAEPGRHRVDLACPRKPSAWDPTFSGTLGLVRLVRIPHGRQARSRSRYSCSTFLSQRGEPAYCRKLRARHPRRTVC